MAEPTPQNTQNNPDIKQISRELGGALSSIRELINKINGETEVKTATPNLKAAGQLLNDIITQNIVSNVVSVINSVAGATITPPNTDTNTINGVKQRISPMAAVLTTLKDNQVILKEMTAKDEKTKEICAKAMIADVVSVISEVAGIEIAEIKTDKTIIQSAKGLIKPLGDFMEQYKENKDNLDVNEINVEQVKKTMQSAVAIINGIAEEADKMANTKPDEEAVLKIDDIGKNIGLITEKLNTTKREFGGLFRSINGYINAWVSPWADEVKIGEKDGEAIMGTVYNEKTQNWANKVNDVSQAMGDTKTGIGVITGTISSGLALVKETIETVDESVLNYFIAQGGNDGSDANNTNNTGATGKKPQSEYAKKVAKIQMAIRGIGAISGAMNAFGNLFTKTIDVAEVKDDKGEVIQKAGKKLISASKNIKEIYDNVFDVYSAISNYIVGETGALHYMNESLQALSGSTELKSMATWATDNPNDKSKGFTANVDKAKTAAGTIKVVSGLINAFVDAFADKKSGIAAKANIGILSGKTQIASTSIQEKIVGEKGALADIYGTVKAVFDNKSLTDLSELGKSNATKANAEKGTNAVAGTMPLDIFTGKVSDAKKAVDALKGISGLPKSFVAAAVSIKNSLNEGEMSFSAAKKLIETFIGEGEKGNVVGAILATVQKVNDTIQARWGEFLAANNGGKWTIKVKTGEKDEKTGEDIYNDGAAPAPWSQTIADTLVVIKAINTLAKLPQAVSKAAVAIRDANFDDTKDELGFIQEKVSLIMGELSGSFSQISLSIEKADINKDSLDSIRMVNDMVNAVRNLVVDMDNAQDELNKVKFSTIIVVTTRVELFAELVGDMIESLDKSFDSLDGAKIEAVVKKINKVIEPVQKLFDNINSLLDIMTEDVISAKKVKSNMKKFRKNAVTCLSAISDELPYIADEIDYLQPTDKEKFAILKRIMGPMNDVLDVIKAISEFELPNPVVMWLRIKQIKNRILLIGNAMMDINDSLAKLPSAQTDPKAIKQINTIVNHVQSIMEVLNEIANISIKLSLKGGFIKTGAKAVENSLDPLNKMIQKLEDLKEPHKAHTKLQRIKAVLTSVLQIVVALILMTPIMALFLIASPIILLAIWGFALVVKFIVTLVSSIVNIKTTLAIMGIGVLLLMLIGIALLLVALVMVVEPLLPKLPLVLLFMGCLVLFVGALALFGLIIQFVAPLIVAATLGILLVSISVLAIFMIAWLLDELANIDLDTEAVKSKVQLVLGTALEIMMLAFGPVSDPRGENGEDVGFLDVVLGAMVNILRALAACVILVLTAISVGAILIIATLLRLLAVIDTGKLQLGATNARVVLGIASDIVDMLFGQSDKETEKSEKGFFGQLIEFAVPAIGKLLQAIFAVAYLALMTIAVALVLFIATMIRMIAIIDTEKLQIGAENARIALGVAADIVTMIFGAPDEESEKSERGFFGRLIEYVIPSIGKFLQAIFAVAYLATMVIAVSLILFLATMIKKIADINQDTLEQGGENARLAVKTAADIVNMLFAGDQESTEESQRGGLLGIVGFLFGSEIENLIRAAFAIAYIGLLLISTTLISFLANRLATIGEIDQDTLVKAGENAVLVVKTARDIMKQIFAPADEEGEEGGSWIKKLLNWVLPKDLVFIIDAMIKIGKLALLVMAVGSIGKLAESLNGIAKFNVTPADAQKKGQQVINASSSLLTNLKSMSENVKIGEKEAGEIYKQCTALAKLPSGLQLIGNNIVKLGQLDASRIETGGTNGATTTRIITEMAEMIEQARFSPATVEGKLATMEKMSRTIGAFVQVKDDDVKNTRAITENYIKFLETVDKMNLTKIQTTELLMRHWSNISRDIRGNFKGLAESINEHIAPTLETLNKTMDEVNKCQKQIIDDLTKPVDLMGGSGPNNTVDVGGSTNSGSTFSGDGSDSGSFSGGSVGSGGVGGSGISSEPEKKTPAKRDIRASRGALTDIGEGMQAEVVITKIIKKL